MNSTFTKSTDAAQRIKLDSNLIYVIWKSKCAYGGEMAKFEVRTSFVGDGAEVKVKGKSENGKNLGNADGTMYSNRYIGELAIPANIDPDDQVYVEVKLPKHNLKGESNRIPARPPILARQIQWDKKEARRGDVLTLTGQFDGVLDNTEASVKIYEYDPNGNHDPVASIPVVINNKKLSVQWEYDYHDDTGQIPTQQELDPYSKNYKHPEYFFVVVIDGIRLGVKQESGLLKFKDFVEIELKDRNGEPMANQKYVITLADGKQIFLRANIQSVFRQTKRHHK
jgi:hypothetical protein